MGDVDLISTAQDLLAAGDIGRCELIQGELVMRTPAGADHGRITAELTMLLGMHVRQHRLGCVYAAETGFQIERDPDTVRAPDVAFVRAERLVDASVPGFFPGAPDLVVEVVSPGERAADVVAKASTWLAAGTRMVWIVWPTGRTVDIYRPGSAMVTRRQGQRLDGEGVVSGFSCDVAAIFQ